MEKVYHSPVGEFHVHHLDLLIVEEFSYLLIGLEHGFSYPKSGIKKGRIHPQG